MEMKKSTIPLKESMLVQKKQKKFGYFLEYIQLADAMKLDHRMSAALLLRKVA
ncbi:MAG: hypothetical protein AAF770_02740 [Bacteroidota bacterium]